MAQWGNTDDAANSVLWATTSVKLPANTANQANLYGNTTADAFITGATYGQFGVDQGETQALRAGANTKVAHTGWNLRKVGSGGRAGRVQYETLIAFGGNYTGSDGSDDAVVPDFKINITTQPSNATVNSSSTSNVATFTVVAASIPSGATLTYQWQKWGGSSFADLSNAGAYSNVTTAALSVKGNTASNGEIYRVQVGNASSGAANAVSSNAVITITT
jgi:hypothetical protein